MEWVIAILALALLQTANPVHEGMKALDGQNYEAAAAAFEQAIAADPGNYGAHFNLAFAKSMLGKPEEAIAGYRKTLELKPGLYQAQINLGILLLEEERAADAIPVLRAAQEQKPAEFNPNYYLAEALYVTDALTEAESFYRKAEEIDAQSPPVQVGLARTLAKQNRLDEAAVHYRNAAANPDYENALLELASLYEQVSENRKAIEIYERFLDNEVVRERLGNLLLQEGDAEAAIGHLEAVIAVSPTAANRYALATAYMRAGRAGQAIPVLKLALAEEPKSFAMRLTYGRLLRDQRQFAPAAQQFLEAVKLQPDSQDAWNELAGMLILIEDYPAALAALDRVEALGSAPPSVHFFRALVLDRMRQYEPALVSYQRFLDLNNGVYPDEEFKARQRIKVIEKELRR